MEECCLVVERNVLFDLFFMVYYMCDCVDSDYYVFDILLDILSNGCFSCLNQYFV